MLEFPENLSDQATELLQEYRLSMSRPVAGKETRDRQNLTFGNTTANPKSTLLDYFFVR